MVSSPHCSPLRANAILDQKVSYRIRPSLGQIKIVAFFPSTVGVTFNQYLGVGVLGEERRQAVQRLHCAGLQRRLARVEQHIAQCYNDTPVGLLCLQLSQLLLSAGELGPRRRGSRLRALSIAVAGLHENLASVLFTPRYLLAGMRLRRPSLTCLGVALREVRMVIHHRRRLLLLQSQLRFLKLLARSLQIGTGGLLGQRVL